MKNNEKLRSILCTILLATVITACSGSDDAPSEAAIFDHFRSESHNKMTILISHRFSTVRAADQIIVIHDGKIIERGNHESLLALGGQYASLFKLQAKGYQ